MNLQGHKPQYELAPGPKRQFDVYLFVLSTLRAVPRKHVVPAQILGKYVNLPKLTQLQEDNLNITFQLHLQKMEINILEFLIHNFLVLGKLGKYPKSVKQVADCQPAK